MSNIMIYQLRLECDNRYCDKHYNLKVPVKEEPELYGHFKDWKCKKCKSGSLIVTSKRLVE